MVFSRATLLCTCVEKANSSNYFNIEFQETTGDNDDSRRGDYGDNKPQTEKDKDKEAKSEKEKLQDNVDSVFLRSGIPHKAHSNASTPQEEEDCGIKCLYYTLQCCDCVLM